MYRIRVSVDVVVSVPFVQEWRHAIVLHGRGLFHESNRSG